MPEIYRDNDLAIELLTKLGPLENNSYIIRPSNGDGPIVVDIPEGFETVLAALGQERERVAAVIVTHSHFDHWNGYDLMRQQISAPVYAGAEESGLDESRDIYRLDDGHQISIGTGLLNVLHTPGHTPGSISLLTGGSVLTGDTLFPGGPGFSRSNEALQQTIDSIISRLHTLPDEVLVLPGHGVATTIGESKAEYSIFAAKDHAPDLHGDVNWLES